jgi:hypothetical protein
MSQVPVHHEAEHTVLATGLRFAQIAFELSNRPSTKPCHVT